jgi:hypothetical protein
VDGSKQIVGALPVCDDAITKSFRASITITVGNGASMLLWKERWLNGQGIEELAPDLLATVPARRRGSRIVCSFDLGRSCLDSRDHWPADVPSAHPIHAAP